MIKDIIIPYYIYHYIDETTNNYYGLISYDNNLSISLYKGWKLYGIFYAFSSFLEKIPDGTKMFSLKIKNYFPYDIKDYKLVYDIFSINNDDIYSVNFITYNRPVPNVKKLYFHQLNDNIFPSFDEKPPTNSKEWILPSINPIFVMTSKVDKFFCDNGRCLPMPIPDEYYKQMIENKDNLNIEDCLKNCNNGISILELIKEKSKQNTFQQSKKNMKTQKKHIIKMNLILFFLFLIIILFCFIKIN